MSCTNRTETPGGSRRPGPLQRARMEREDPMRPSRGILLAVIIGTAAWIAIVVAAYTFIG